MDTQQLQALAIAARLRSTQEDGAWSVPSSSGNGKYRVILKPDGNTCTGPNFELTGTDGKHVLAAPVVRERAHGDQPLLIDTDTLPEKKTYKQDGKAYHLAQTTEKHRFQALLFDLCRGRKRPERARRRGRPKKPLADMAFSAVFKVDIGFSARRFHCDLPDAHASGYLSALVHGHAVNPYLENPALTPILRQLSARNALPLRTVETAFAPDSSGFSTSKCERWYDAKYGCYRSGHVWVKAQIMVGVPTGVATAVEVNGQNAADSPPFGPLVSTTAQHFDVQEVSADKAYLSNANLETVAALGGTAFIPFKSNSAAGAGVWAKMFHSYQFRREECLQH